MAIPEQIMRLVGDQAVEMVETTIGEVDMGLGAAMKYRFERIGPYPATAQKEAAADNSRAKTPPRRLGLPENPALDNPVTRVYEVEPVAEGDTVK